MEQTKTYDAILFRQREDAPLQVCFAAPSSEIDSWARVPTKNTGNVRNFQRAEIPRHVEEIEAFFSASGNSSPTAIVVGFEPTRAKGRVITKIEGKVVSDVDVPPGTPQMGTVTISWTKDEDPQTAEEVRSAIQEQTGVLAKYIYTDLKDITGKAEKDLDEILVTLVERIKSGIGPEETEGGDIETEVTEDSEEEAGAAELEIPSDVKGKLAGLSPSEQQVVVGRLYFLAQLRPEFLAGQSLDDLQKTYEGVRDELKPAILIDGQHRVKGTKKLGSIPFLVTALPSADWPELAFQFIVTNRTARRVPESLLISIVGNSLSKQQRAEIEERLRKAGIRVGLIEAVMRVHEDDLSPFYKMLAFGLKNEQGFLDAAAMRGKVIQLWYERLPPVRTLFDHLCKGKRQTERTEYWRDEELWFQMFITFWDAVKERYKGTNVFSPDLVDKTKKTPASKLMTATVLKMFQETVLRHLQEYLNTKVSTEGVSIAESLPSEEKFGELIGNLLAKLTPDFFEGWQLTGFDGSKGARDDLQDAMLKVLKGEKTPAQLKAGKNPHRLFKEM